MNGTIPVLKEIYSLAGEIRYRHSYNMRQNMKYGNVDCGEGPMPISKRGENKDVTDSFERILHEDVTGMEINHGRWGKDYLIRASCILIPTFLILKDSNTIL